MTRRGRPVDPDALAAALELDVLRARIDELDRQIVELLNRRATIALAAGRAKAATGRRGIRDADREREVLLRVAMANAGPLPQAELLGVYRRLIRATVELERRDRERGEGG